MTSIFCEHILNSKKVWSRSQPAMATALVGSLLPASMSEGGVSRPGPSSRLHPSGGLEPSVPSFSAHFLKKPCQTLS